MESKGSFPCSQETVTDLHPEPDESSPHLPILLSSHLYLGLLSGLFPSGFLTTTEIHYCVHEPAINPYPKPDIQSTHSHPISIRSF